MTNADPRPRIAFERPNVRQLRVRGLQAVDMHFHTRYSDAFTSVRGALTLAKRKGVGLAITDHNTPSGTLEALRADPGILFVPGMEISAEDGPHLLLYFYDPSEMREFYRREIERHKGKSPYLATDLTTLDLLDTASGYSCVRAAAHPFGYLFLNKGIGKSVEKGYVPEEALARLEALEVLNGSMTRTVNRRAGDLAAERGYGIMGGSDGHRLGDLGNVVTVAESADVEGFLADIVKGRSSVVGLEKNPLGKGVTGSLQLARFAPYTVSSLRVHYRQNAPRLRRFAKRHGRGAR